MSGSDSIRYRSFLMLKKPDFSDKKIVQAGMICVIIQ